MEHRTKMKLKVNFIKYQMSLPDDSLPMSSKEKILLRICDLRQCF